MNLIGQAARCGEPFWVADKARHEMFQPGMFRTLERPIVLGVNHAVCRCRTSGRIDIDPTLVLASTEDGTLVLEADDHGLFFHAHVPPNACVAHGDTPPYNILDAIRADQCRGVSIHGHGGERLIGPDVPADVFVWASMRIVELSLTLPPVTACGSPGTWVRES